MVHGAPFTERRPSMNKKSWISAAGVVTAVAVVCYTTGVGRAAAQEAVAKEHAVDTEVLARCADACLKCAKECESCFAHCTEHASMGHKDHVPSMKHCIDCADFCSMC